MSLNTRTIFRTILCGLLLALALAPSMAGWISDTQQDPLPQTKPFGKNFQTTIGEGESPIIDGNIKSAKENAKNGALRDAIEKVIGIYVEASSRGENYQMVKDEIYTHSDGFARVQDILSEGIKDGVYKIKASVEVSLEPLTDKLAKSGLTRRWRVMVVIPEIAAENAIIDELVKSNYRVVDQTLSDKLGDSPDAEAAANGDLEAAKRIFSKSKADILVIGDATSQDAGSIAGLLSCRARVDAKVIRRDSGVIITSASGQQGGADITEEMARKTALERAGRDAAKSILREISVLPASTTLPVELIVRNCPDIATLEKVEKAVLDVIGVRSVQRDEFDNGTAYLEISIDSAFNNDIQLSLEKLKTPILTIKRASKNSIEVQIKDGKGE